MPARELIGPCDLEVGRKELVPACLHNGIVGRGSAEVCYPYLSRLFPTYIDELVGRLGRFDSAGVEAAARVSGEVGRVTRGRYKRGDWQCRGIPC